MDRRPQILQQSPAGDPMYIFTNLYLCITSDPHTNLNSVKNTTFLVYHIYEFKKDGSHLSIISPNLCNYITYFI